MATWFLCAYAILERLPRLQIKLVGTIMGNVVGPKCTAGNALKNAFTRSTHSKSLDNITISLVYGLNLGILLIPAVLELVFSIGLIVAGRGQGRRRFILAAEGFVYMFLAILDMIAHEVPTFRDSLISFKVLDIIIGAASVVPVALFTVFLYIFKRAEFFPYFPRRFVFVANSFALVVIPVLLCANELGSFIGNSYAFVTFLPDSFGDPPITTAAVGTRNDSAETARVFFNSLGLALMSTYAVVTFLVFFVRLAGSFVRQREIEDSGGMQDETYLFKGTGWVALGMALSAAESFVGFADGQFGVIFTRRILRMLGRACVIIGIVKGPDRHLHFDMLDHEKETRRARRNTTLRLQISNPLLVSSTQRLSTLPAVDLAPPRTASMRDFSRIQSMEPLRRYGSVPLDESLANRSQQRVTVSMGRGRAPTLILRLSSTNLPSPNTFMPSRGARSNRPSLVSARYSLSDDPEAYARHQAQLEAENAIASPASAYSPGRSPWGRASGEPLRSRWSSSGHDHGSPHPRRMSLRDSLLRASALFGRLARFPQPPKETPYNPAPAPAAEDGLLRRASSRRKPAPPVRESMFENTSELLSRDNFASSRAPGALITDTSRLRDVPETSYENLASSNSPDSLTSGQWIATYPRQMRPMTAVAALVPVPLSFEEQQPRVPPRRRPQSLDIANMNSTSFGSDMPLSGASAHAMDMDWLVNPESAPEQTNSVFDAVRSHARSSSQAIPAMLARGLPASRPSLSSLASTDLPALTDLPPPPARQLSFGTVARRKTPTPSSTPVRGSIALEHDSMENAHSHAEADDDAASATYDMLPPVRESIGDPRGRESVASTSTSELMRKDSSVLPPDLEDVRRRRASQF